MLEAGGPRVPYRSIPVQRARTITPDQAPVVAAELRSIAGRARELAGQLRSISGDMDATWQGRSQVRFLMDFGGEPGNGASAAAWVEDRGRYVAAMTVTVMETVMETVWVPE